jgi:hypothetical protein
MRRGSAQKMSAGSISPFGWFETKMSGSSGGT